MRSLQQFWSVRRIGEDRVTLARLGSLRLWLARADREWGFAFSYGEEKDLMDFAQVPEDVVPEKLKWASILFREAPRDYQFGAVAPKRPLSVQAMGPISLPSGESGSLYLIVPVAIDIRVLSGEKSQSLGTVSTERLRRSWFGSPVEGRFCFANPAELMTTIDRTDVNPNHIIFPVEIKNSSDKMLRFDKLCLDLSHAGLYSGVLNLWGSPVTVEFNGPNRECLLTCTDGPPAMEKDLLEVASPRKIETRNMARTVISCCNPI